MNRKRHASLSLIYQGQNITAQVAPFVVGFSFTDNAHGKADDLSITLEDSSHLWKGSWRPVKGDLLEATIHCENWLAEEQGLCLPCGSFEIDEVELSVSATAGDTVTLKAVSAMVQNSIRREKKTRAWENASLKRVARDIAVEAGLELVFDLVDFIFERVDQRDETDLALLTRLAERAGINLKVAEGSLVLFDSVLYDARPAVLSLHRSHISSGRIRTKTCEIYRGCTVAWHDSAAKEDRQYTFVPPAAPASGQMLKINKRVESQAEAMSLAAKELRNKNKHECEGTFSLMGDPRLRGGAVLALTGYRAFDGNYTIESATHVHSRNAGYTTSVNLRRTVSY